MSKNNTPKLEEMRAKLLALLQDMAAEIGPRDCEHGDFSECDVCSWEDTKPLEGTALLSEFVLVMNWTTMETGDCYIGIQKAPHQLLTHTNGLLHTALYEI